MSNLSTIINSQYDLLKTNKKRFVLGDFEGIATVTSESVDNQKEIPVHYLEDGSFVSDHIIQQPKVISLDGQVGDIVWRQSALQADVQKVAVVAGIADNYLPSRSATVTQKILNATSSVNNAIAKIDSVIQDVNTAIDIVSSGETLQDKFLNQLEIIYNNNLLINLYVNYKEHPDMMLISYQISRDANSGAIKFNLKFQQLLVAKIIYSKLSKNIARAAVAAAQDKTERGATNGNKVSDKNKFSVAEKIYNFATKINI